MTNPAQHLPQDRHALERAKWGDKLLPPSLLLGHLAPYGELGTWFLEHGATLMRELPDRPRELAALRVSVVRGCVYVWAGHVLIALHLGLGTYDIARVAVGSEALNGHDAAVLRAVDAVLDKQPIDDETRAELGDVDALGITFAAKFYDWVATKMAGEAPEPGIELIPGLETPARAASLALLQA